MNLNKEEVLLLIQEYEKHRLLWDPKAKWHFNKNQRSDAWEEVAKSSNIDVEDAKKKMLSLLASFRREKSKGIKIVGTGRAAKEVYKSDWFAFKSFEFMTDIEKKRLRKTFKLEQVNNDDVEYPKVEAIYSSPTCSSASENCSEMSMEENGSAYEEVSRMFLKSLSPKNKRAKNTDMEEEKEDSQIQKTFECAVLQPIEPGDSTTKFTKYLAEKLNQFEPRTKSILIHKINLLVFDAEMRTYPVDTDLQKSLTVSYGIDDETANSDHFFQW